MGGGRNKAEVAAVPGLWVVGAWARGWVRGSETGEGLVGVWWARLTDADVLFLIALRAWVVARRSGMRRERRILVLGYAGCFGGSKALLETKMCFVRGGGLGFGGESEEGEGARVCAENENV